MVLVLVMRVRLREGRLIDEKGKQKEDKGKGKGKEDKGKPSRKKDKWKKRRKMLPRAGGREGK